MTRWLEGELALPADAGALEPFVDVDDIADVAVAALTEDGHSGQLYELTGPRLITLTDAVEEIGRATGRELRYQQIPMADFEAGLAAEGVPDDVVGCCGTCSPRCWATTRADRRRAAGAGTRAA